MADFREVSSVGGLGSLGESKMRAAARRNQERQASTGGARGPARKPAFGFNLGREVVGRKVVGTPVRDPNAQAKIAALRLQARGVPTKLNVPGAIVKAQSDAAKLNNEALALAKQVKPLILAGRKEEGGKLAIAAISKARTAAILQTKAAKTLAVGQREAVAAAKVAQAKTITGAVDRNTALFNGQGEDGAKAQAGMLFTQAAELRQEAATIAAGPDLPSGFPSESRIADVASKFDARIRLRNRGPLSIATLSVLQGLDVGSQANKMAVLESTDPQTVLGYYGADAIGVLMRDIDLGVTNSASVAGLGSLGKSLMPGATAKTQAKVKGTAENKAAVAEKAAFDSAAAAMVATDGPGAAFAEGEGGIVGWLKENWLMVSGGVAALTALGGGVWYWKKMRKA